MLIEAPSSPGAVVLRPESEGSIVLPFLACVLRADGTAEPIPVTTMRETEDGTLLAEGAGSSFTARLRLGAAEGTPARRRAELTLTCTHPVPLEAGIRVECRLGETDDPGWLIPGLFYGENRWPDSSRLYPRFSITEDPGRLEASTWAFRSDRAATPAIIAYDRRGGAALVTAETSALGESGLGFTLKDGRPLLRLHFPYREEPVVYYGTETPLPARTPMIRFAPGTRVELGFSLYLLSDDRHGYAPLLRREHAETPPTRDAVAWVGIEEAAELTAEGLRRWHYRPDPPVLLETAAFDREALGERGDRPAMHVSWVSGIPYAYALLRHGRRLKDDVCTEEAAAVIEHCCANLTPGGTFWGQWKADQGWTTGWTPEPGRLHARTLADATLFAGRALLAERAAGADRPTWENAVRSNLAVAVAGQRADGALGAAFSAESGSVLDWRGSAGLAFVAPLAEAASTLGEKGLLDAARAAGHYYAHFVEGEYLCGAPEDVDLAPTSEDGYLAVLSYMALARSDPDGPWLELARRAADWMLTFRYTYDVSFSPQTLLGQYRFRTRGADQASPSNQHLHAFGLICTKELAELSAATGDPHYRERAIESLACFRQFIAREDGDFDAYRGMASERFYQTTCFQAKGMLLTLSHAWSVGVILLACEDAIASGEAWDEPAAYRAMIAGAAQ